MARYFFHLHECGRGTLDEEGTELVGVEEARQRAIHQARSIMSAELLEGRLCLSCHIDVVDGRGQRVVKVPFKEALTLSGL